MSSDHQRIRKGEVTDLESVFDLFVRSFDGLTTGDYRKGPSSLKSSEREAESEE